MSTDRNLQSARGRGGNAWGERAGEEFALGHYLDNNRVIVGKASWVGLRWFMQRFTWVKNPARARERERERERFSLSERSGGGAAGLTDVAKCRISFANQWLNLPLRNVTWDSYSGQLWVRALNMFCQLISGSDDPYFVFFDGLISPIINSDGFFLNKVEIWRKWPNCPTFTPPTQSYQTFR